MAAEAVEHDATQVPVRQNTGVALAQNFLLDGAEGVDLGERVAIRGRGGRARRRVGTGSPGWRSPITSAWMGAKASISASAPSSRPRL
jgi:hypothetical protein